MQYLIETEHLGIRIFNATDAQRLYENHSENEVKQFISNESYTDIDETKDAIDFYMACVQRNQLPFVLAAVLKETQELIGDIGINGIEGEGHIGEVEIGYSICSKYKNRGYATELVEAMTKFVSHKFDVKVLFGRVIHGNNASARVLEKNGYVFLREEFGAEDDPYGKGMLIYKKSV